MQYNWFKVKNFKGIQELKFDLTKSHQSPVILFVGLNESGKTTVLEALTFFYDNIKREKEQKIRSEIIGDIHDLIPKNLKDNFNEKIVIESQLIFEESDKVLIENFFKENKAKIEGFGNSFELKLEINFENSNYKNKNVYFNFNAQIKAKGDKKYHYFSHTHSLWGPFYEFINRNIPTIIYYPNFLFDFPDKIFLEEIANESVSHKEQPFYRNILQDVLDSLDNNLSIQTHVIDRLQSGKQNDRDSLESVINKISEQLTNTIVNQDYGILNYKNTKRDIIVTMPKYDAKDQIYIELKIKEGSNSYYIRERSLGFKWYFIFLLFTQFRINRRQDKGKLYFLFDEPASNLHQTAQQKILSAINKMTSNGHVSIIYTTHSHHLIDPLWLESTYIVKNQALDYDDEESFDSRLTDIKMEPYRSFVGKYPEQRYYFQPILDVLEYKPSNLEFVPEILMLEGKTDFYTFNYFNSQYYKIPDLHILPGGGSGSLSGIIQLYLAWGREFLIILDSDKEGRDSKKHYLDTFGSILNDKIYTLLDINKTWNNHAIEKLITESDKNLIISSIFSGNSDYSKKKLHLSIQELLVHNQEIVGISDETLNNFKMIIEFYKDKIRSI